MNNYEFCTKWVFDQNLGGAARVLDYGCGSGQIVTDLRNRNINAFGCDAFYEGGDYSVSMDAKLLETGIVRRMVGDTIPFEPASFDIVVNNQVMEHVENLDVVLAEMHRVLKPGGVVLSLFPDRGVWREGHCGIPFLHWFPKNSRLRVYYAAGLRALGFGYHKGTKSAMHWSRDFCEWLDKWTHYRSRREVQSTYRKYFQDIKHIEDNWLQARVGRATHPAAWLPTSMQKQLVLKLAGMIFIASKSGR